jgi:hypothetical protein
MGDLFSNKITEILASEEEHLSHNHHHHHQPTTMASTARVLRTTMFRIADPANQQKLIQAYNKLAAEQKKVCLSLSSLPPVHQETLVCRVPPSA